MQLAKITLLLARAALLSAGLTTIFVGACTNGADDLGTCTPTAGKGGRGGTAGTSGSGGIAGTVGEGGGDSSEGGDPQAGGMDTGGTGGSSGSGGGGGVVNVGGGGRGGSGGGGASGGAAGSGVSGGSGGGGGSGGTAGSGSMLKICQECEEKCNDFDGLDVGTDYCLHGPGVAQAGPAKGVELSLLCAEALDCFYTSKCNAPGHDIVECYCGTSGTACPTGGANGPCVPEVESSAETAAYADITARFGDATYALGRAALVMQCYNMYCPEKCF